MQVFGVNCLLDIISLFMCYVFLFSPVLALRPGKQFIAIVAQHGF